MNLFNKKILNQRIANFTFPKGEEAENISKLITGWQKALKDSDLSKTKEKSIQGKFLNVFFEQILGYEDKTGGLDEWSLIAEPKTEVDSQVADGSLGFFTKDKKETKAVIELKDAKTSLDKKQKGREKGYSPVEQGYLYATKFDRCKWIIVSNFREIRLYNKARSEQFYEKFDVLDLHNEDGFKKFYFLLQKDNLIAKEGDSPIDDLAKKSTDQEEDISKKFYSDYKEVRTALYNHLSKGNQDLDKKTLFEKSQKILDRIVFILFCEDTANLLPKNILKETYEFGKRSRQRSDEKVWLEMKNLFIDIDEGREDIDPKINGYNGGLFKFDEILDNLHIKDDIWDSVIKLSDYDFETDLNVNILGHIFEQSISDIENPKAELEDTEQDKRKSKRKKDGIFYTPEYITKYIVENTVGKYLEENPDKLESIKILDPACGSGAFLNQAHSYLINEYKVRHEQKLIEKEKKGEALTLFDYNPAEANRAILLNNLYGVDLNDESVEITKLSLWLKTARKDEPLQNLDNNIKVGNSLIDDPEVAGEKAFDWKKEYKEIIKDGGFDVIIGNPPYVRNELINKKDKAYFENNYADLYTGKSDLYVYFFQRYFDLLKSGGYGAMIVSSKYTKTKYGKPLIDFLVNNTEIIEYIDFKDSNVFDGIIAYPSIIIFRKSNIANTKSFLSVLDSQVEDVADLSIMLKNEREQIAQSKLFDFIGMWNGRNTKKLYEIFSRLKENFSTIRNSIKKPQVGIKTGFNKAYILDSMSDINLESIYIKKYVTGKDVKRYKQINPEKYIIFPYLESKDGLVLANETDLPKDILFHLKEHRENLEKRAIIKDGIIDGSKHWYEYQQIKTDFDYGKYIIYPDISNGVNFTFCEGLPYDMTCFGIENDDINILAILNSKLIKLYLELSTVKARGGYLRLKSQYILSIPMPEKYEMGIDNEVKKLLALTSEIEKDFIQFSGIVKSRYDIDLNFSIVDFLETGQNQIYELFNNLSIEKQNEAVRWLFEKKEILGSMVKEREGIVNLIDKEVYGIYGLTQEEINVIEGAV